MLKGLNIKKNDENNNILDYHRVDNQGNFFTYFSGVISL